MTPVLMKSQDKVLEQGLKQLWRLRMDQKITECRQMFDKLLRKSKTDPETFPGMYLKNATKATISGESLSVLTSAFLLRLSLLRADGDIQSAISTLDTIEQTYLKKHLPFPFQFYFQKGNNFLYRADFTSALEQFVMATRAATTNEDRVCSLSNTLYCLENLGQAYEGVLCQLKEQLQTIPVNKLSGVRTQFAALMQRHHFRQGTFRELFLDASTNESTFRLGLPDGQGSTFRLRRSAEYRFRAVPRPPDGQEAHLRFWCAELPYHTFYHFLSTSEQEYYFTQLPDLFHKSYRSRTLQGQVNASDFTGNIRESDFADRFYLWTWRWLVDPNTFSFEKIIVLLENSDLQEMSPRFTVEDYCLIRNALLWISLFVPRYSAEIERMARSIRKSTTSHYPLLEFEKQLVEHLRYQIKGIPDKLNWSKGLIWENGDLKLKDLISGTKPVHPPLQDLARRIQELSTHNEYKNGVTYVDLGKREIVRDGGRKRLVSEPLCLALDLLHRKECISFETFLSTCFGIPQFDSVIHNAKVYNLIARIKELFEGELPIQTKSGRIYCYGPWDTVEFQSPSTGLEDLFREKDLERIFKRNHPVVSPSNTRAVRPANVTATKNDPTVLSRHELEAATGKSRASANRIIKTWLDQGIVKKTGQARNTRYTVIG